MLTGAEKTIFEAAITGAKFQIEKNYKREGLELIQFFFDFHDKKTLTQYYKFAGSNDKLKAEPNSLTGKDESTFSEIMLGKIKKQIADLQVLKYADLIVDVKAKTIKSVTVYYTNKLNVDRIFEQKN